MLPQQLFVSLVPSQVSTSLIHVEPSGHVSRNKIINDYKISHSLYCFVINKKDFIVFHISKIHCSVTVKFCRYLKSLLLLKSKLNMEHLYKVSNWHHKNVKQNFKFHCYMRILCFSFYLFLINVQSSKDTECNPKKSVLCICSAYWPSFVFLLFNYKVNRYCSNKFVTYQYICNMPSHTCTSQIVFPHYLLMMDMH